MRSKIDPATGMQAGAAAMGPEERSDEAPRAKDGQDRPAPDPEVAAKPTRRQFTAANCLRTLKEADRCTRPREAGRRFAVRVCTPRISPLGANRAVAVRFNA